MASHDKVAIGVSAGSYSQAISASAGRLVFVSGQVAVDDDGQVVAPGEMEAQARVVFERIAGLLKVAGGGLADVVKLTTFVTQMDQYAAFSKVRSEVFSSPFPASTAVEVTRLVEENLVIEIEAIAIVTGGVQPAV
jgi:2-iminobutanoate/2-iminopropanoate deaminase